MKKADRENHSAGKENAAGKGKNSGKKHASKKHDPKRNGGSKRSKNHRRKSSVQNIVIAVILLFLAGSGGYKALQLQEGSDIRGQMQTSDRGGGSLQDSTVASGEMQVTFLDVGQGDCTIVRTEGHNMVIDTGNNNKGSVVVEWLQEQGITELDYLVLTHPDADHIGGADDVLRAVKVDTVLMPDVENDTVTYEEVAELIEEQQIPVIYPAVGEQYTLGDAGFTILCPQPDEVSESDLNGSSVGMKLVHGSNSFVMCGDAEEASEGRMVDTFGDALEADVLKCGHHGSSTATSDAFLAAVDPIWAVISCGAGNSYGHPHQEVLTKLEDGDVQVYRTDLLGTITAVSDGEQITWSSAGEQR